MKNVNLFFLLVSLLLHLSCSETKKTTGICDLDLSSVTQELPEVLKIETSIVKLEKSPNSLLRNIQRAYVDFEGDRIFVLSFFNIYIFNGDGAFVAKLAVGRGPGEIQQVSSFAIDPTSKTLCALDMSMNLVLYNYSGEFLRKYTIKDYSFIDAHYLDSENIFLVGNYVGGEEQNYIALFNFKENRIIQKFIPAENSPYKRTGGLIPTNSFSDGGEGLIFYNPNIFGLHEFNNHEFKRIVNFNLGNKMVPAQLADEYILNQRNRFREVAINKGFVPYILYSFIYKDRYFVILDDEDVTSFVIARNDCNDIVKVGSINKYFNLPDVNSMKYPVGIQKEGVIFTGNPVDFLDEEGNTQGPIKLNGVPVSVSIEDNPFLIICNRE